ncbi:MAG: hypothetical protein HN348_32730 [Proteobacteria bacterium]|nr:hypothetical protein [Pseudomonadota bacterium]
MRDRYLEVTYRKGKPLAGYLHLPRTSGLKAVRTERIGDGLLVDYGEGDIPVGLEITSPSTTSVEQVDQALRSLGLEGVFEDELAPLAA